MSRIHGSQDLPLPRLRSPDYGLKCQTITRSQMVLSQVSLNASEVTFSRLPTTHLHSHVRVILTRNRLSPSVDFANGIPFHVLTSTVSLPLNTGTVCPRTGPYSVFTSTASTAGSRSRSESSKDTTKTMFCVPCKVLIWWACDVPKRQWLTLVTYQQCRFDLRSDNNRGILNSVNVMQGLINSTKFNKSG